MQRRVLCWCVLSVLVTGRICLLTALGVEVSVGFLKFSVKIFSEIPRALGYQQPPKSVKVGRSVLAQTTLPSFLPSFLGTTPLYFFKTFGVKILLRKEAVGGKGQPTGRYRGFHFPHVDWHGTEHGLGSCGGSTHLLTPRLIGGYYSPFC